MDSLSERPNEPASLPEAWRRPLEAELQAKRVAAFRAFATDVESGAYPEPRHQLDMDDQAYERFLVLSQQI